MAGERYFHFHLNIDPDELMRVYRGAAHRLRVRSLEGPVVDLDANHRGLGRQGFCYVVIWFISEPGASTHFLLRPRKCPQPDH